MMRVFCVIFLFGGIPIISLGKKVPKAKSYGEVCKEQIECSRSGDPHLQCLSTNDKQNRCLCSNSYDLVDFKCTKKHFHVNKMKPLPISHKSKPLSYPPLQMVINARYRLRYPS